MVGYPFKTQIHEWPKRDSLYISESEITLKLHSNYIEDENNVNVVRERRNEIEKLESTVYISCSGFTMGFVWKLNAENCCGVLRSEKRLRFARLPNDPLLPMEIRDWDWTESMEGDRSHGALPARPYGASVFVVDGILPCPSRDDALRNEDMFNEL